MKFKKFIITSALLRITYKALSSNTKTETPPVSTAGYKKMKGCLIGTFLFCIYTLGLLSLIINPRVGIVIIILTITGQLLFYFSDKQKTKRALQKAFNEVKENNIPKALEFFKEAYSYDKSDYQTLRNIGYSYRLNEEYDNAIETLEKYLSKYPDDYFAVLLLGSSYYNTELFEKAIEVLQVIPESDENLVKVLELIGASFYQLGKTDLALDTFQRAPLNQPLVNEDLKELHYNLGLIYNDIGEEEKALLHFKKIYARGINFKDVKALIESLELSISLSSLKVKGEIGYYGLSEWWQKELTDNERKIILKTYNPMGTYNYLISGKMISLSRSKLSFLSTLATWFKKPKTYDIAKKLIEKAEEFVPDTANIIDVHYHYQNKLGIYYRNLSYDETALSNAIKACEKQIAISANAAKALREKYEDRLPSHKGYQQLAIIKAKQKNYKEVINICEEARKMGWDGDWQKRIQSAKKKLAL